ncbi:hypothetical protein ES703_13643 [subsurface metagenome]
MKKPKMIEEGVYKIPLVLPKSLEPQRDELEETLLLAQRRLRAFAVRNGWDSFVREKFADRAEIYDDKGAFDIAFCRLGNVDPSIELPRTYSAALEKAVFIAVSPELYSKNYPEGVEEKSFEKLITHEIAHRLHIRILEGDEDAMGPIWFYEGFAIYAAGQFETFSLDSTEIWKIVRSTERESYRKYGAVFRYFLKMVSIRELIEHAGKDDFQEWLQQIEHK